MNWGSRKYLIAAGCSKCFSLKTNKQSDLEGVFFFFKLSLVDIQADNFNRRKKLFTVQCCLAANTVMHCLTRGIHSEKASLGNCIVQTSQNVITQT